MIFGVCCEAISRQIKYLIDEAVNIGKGSNAIVSMLHHFFAHHGIGEETVHQLWWAEQKHDHSTVPPLESDDSFMIPGLTKFSPDWCFRLFKKYRRTKVGGLTNLIGVVNESASVNVAQPTGLEDGSVVVTTYDWQEYFKTFCTKVKGIKKLGLTQHILAAYP